MRIILSIAITLFLSVYHLTAQAIFSFDAGVINSKISITGVDNFFPSDINNYFISFGGGYRLNDRIEFKADLEYSTKGYDMRTGDDQFDIKIYNYNYLSLAPQFYFRPIPMLSLIGGISFDQKLRERSRQAGFGSGQWFNTNTLKDQDINLLYGISVHYQFMYFKLLLENGLVNINDVIYTDENGDQIPNVVTKNKSLQLGIGFYFW